MGDHNSYRSIKQLRKEVIKMLSVLERSLLGEVLLSKFPGIQPDQVEASIRQAESVVTQAVNSRSSIPSDMPVMAGYGPLNTPMNTGNVNLPTVNPYGEPERGYSFNTGGNVGPIGFGWGATIRRENWLTDAFDDLKKPACKAAATAAYSAAIAAITGLNPVAAAAGQAVATAAYHKALDQC